MLTNSLSFAEVSAASPSTHLARARPQLGVVRRHRGSGVAVLGPYDVVRSGIASALTGLHGGPGLDVAVFDLTVVDTRLMAGLIRAVDDPTTVVLGLVHPLAPELGDMALDLGVDGCLPLQSGLSELRSVVVAAQRSRLVAHGRARGVDYRQNPFPADVGVMAASLSPRELETLAWICRGLSNQEIAQRIMVSVNTVKTYIRTAYRKLGIDSRSQAVLWGLQRRVSDVARRDSNYS